MGCLSFPQTASTTSVYSSTDHFARQVKKQFALPASHEWLISIGLWVYRIQPQIFISSSTPCLLIVWSNWWYVAFYHRGSTPFSHCYGGGWERRYLARADWKGCKCYDKLIPTEGSWISFVHAVYEAHGRIWLPRLVRVLYLVIS